MFTKVSVLTPTRQRLDRLATMLASYAATTQGCERASELVFRVDEDDVETQDFLGGYSVLVGPRLQGYESLSLFFNELVPLATGDVLMFGNDDMVFRTSGWAPLILAEANKYPDGLFDFGVKTLNDVNFPFSIISRLVAERLGFICDPRVFWGDIFLRDVMATFGRAVPLPAVHIEHAWMGFNPDPVFVEGNAQRFLPRGAEYWDGVHRQAVEEAVNKLKELVAA